jgi:hypothetical protein
MRWSWHGLVAVILALAVGGSWGVAVVMLATNDRPIGTAEVIVLTSVGSILATGVATWLGGMAPARRSMLGRWLARKIWGEEETTSPPPGP